MADSTDYLLGTFRQLISPSKDEASKPKPRGYSARANEKVSKQFASKPRNVQALNKNWDIYSQSEVPFAAVTVLTYNIVGDWKIRCNNADVQAKIEKFCYNTDFNTVLIDVVRDCLVFGDSFVEKVYNKAHDLVELRVRDPRTFQKQVDDKGDVVKYLQVVSTTDGDYEVDLKPEEVVHYQLFSRPDSPYGLALLDPSKDTILRKTLADEGISAAIDRHGYPKFHIILKTPPGFDTELPTSSEIDSISADFRNINSKNEIVTTELIEIKALDAKGVENVEEYFNYFQSSLTCGLLVPQEVLGLGSGSTEATARVRRLMFEKMVRNFERKIGRTSELSIFTEFTTSDDDQPKLIFADVVPEDDAILADLLKKMMPKDDPFAVLTRDEIRERLGYPPYELSKSIRQNAVKAFTGDTTVENKSTNVSDLDALLSEYKSKVHDFLRTKVD